MSYQLRTDELLASGLKRIATEQLDLALSDLQSGKIYELRKGIKRLRALLRLVKPELGPAYAEENRRLRDIAQRFSAQRDAEVSLEVLEKFAEQYKRKRTLDPQRTVLVSKVAAVQASSAFEDLLGVLKRVERWSLHGLTIDDLSSRLAKTQKEARHALHKALETRSPDDFHEFRKLVKRELNQAKLLRPEEERLTSLKRLGDYLGDHHNLVVLLLNVGQTSRRFGLLVRKEQRALELEAIALGSQLFMKPSVPAPVRGKPQRVPPISRRQAVQA